MPLTKKNLWLQKYTDKELWRLIVINCVFCPVNGGLALWQGGVHSWLVWTHVVLMSFVWLGMAYQGRIELKRREEELYIPISQYTQKELSS